MTQAHTIIEEASRRAKAAMQARKDRTSDMLDTIKAVKGEAIACVANHLMEAHVTLGDLTRIALQAVPLAQRDMVAAEFQDKCAEIMSDLHVGMCASHKLDDKQEAEVYEVVKPLLEAYGTQIAELDKIGAETQAKLKGLMH